MACVASLRMQIARWLSLNEADVAAASSTPPRLLPEAGRAFAFPVDQSIDR